MSEVDRMLEAIARALEPLAEVRAALLFGSHARGRARKHSDIDVAALLDRPADDPHAQWLRMIDPLSSELAADRIDLVILNHAPPALAFQVVKYGRVAFERDPRDLHRFRLRTYSQHADREPVERFFREVTRRRALAGAVRG